MKTVLVVDDEEYMSEFLPGIIKRKGFNAITATDGLKAVETFRERKPEIVFLDLNLPELNGEGVFRAIKEIDPGVKVYLMSGSHHDLFRLKAANAGASGYLVKPLSVEDIFKVLDANK